MMKLQAGITALAVSVGLFAVACDQSAPSALPDDAAVPAAPQFDFFNNDKFSPVTIVTAVDFNTTPIEPWVSGTFEVTEGAGALGCSEGLFFDLPSCLGRGNITKILSCTDGHGGTFAVNFTVGPRPGPGAAANGHWNVVAGFGPLASLQGGGLSSLDFTSPSTGVETLTGKIH
jgi:hypothetical protein